MVSFGVLLRLTHQRIVCTLCACASASRKILQKCSHGSAMCKMEHIDMQNTDSLFTTWWHPLNGSWLQFFLKVVEIQKPSWQVEFRSWFSFLQPFCSRRSGKGIFAVGILSSRRAVYRLIH